MDRIVLRTSTRLSAESRVRPATRAAMLAAVATLLQSFAAYAVPVSVTGAFTTFSGNVGDDGFQFTTTINGSAVCPDAGCGSGIGMVNLVLNAPSVSFENTNFGVPQTANFLGFAPAAPQEVASIGDEFLLGTLTFTNGIWFTGPLIGFTLVTSSPFSAFDGQTFTDSLQLTITTNATGNTPAQNTDYFSFAGHPDLGNFNAYEVGDAASNTVAVDLYGRIGSLIPTRFANPSGGGFIGSGVTPVILPQPTTVPEPTSLALFGLGLAGLALSRARRSPNCWRTDRHR